MTYLISSPIQMFGNTTVEAGAILKFANYTNASVKVVGGLTWNGQPYNPVILTSIDDDSVGETMFDTVYGNLFSQENGPPQPYTTGVPASRSDFLNQQ